MSDGAAQDSNTGAGAGSTASDAPAQQSGAAASSKSRQPVDPAKREAAARRAKVRALTRKVGAAASEDEFWRLTEDLAKKQGKAITAPAAASQQSAQAVDPLDERVGPKWPTKREVLAATPTAKVLLAQVATKTKGTRYAEAGEVAQTSCEEALAACIAPYAADMKDMSPGGALALTALMAFGPTLAAHAGEFARSWYESRQQAAVAVLPEKTDAKPEAKKKAAA